MGTRHFFNDQAHEYRDNYAGSDRDKRLLDELIAKDDARLSRIMADQYSDTERRLSGEIESVLRICEDGAARVEEILEDLRNGNIKPREAAAQLGAAKRDLNRLRKLAKDAPGIEQKVWEQVDKTPGEFQRDVARRFPALFQNGRGLLALPTDDD